jgi:hypothetical protein
MIFIYFLKNDFSHLISWIKLIYNNIRNIYFLLLSFLNNEFAHTITENSKEIIEISWYLINF